MKAKLSLFGLITVTALGAMAAVVIPVKAIAPPPSNALEILWADYCGRTSDPACALPSASASVGPSPSSSASPTPTLAPTPSPTPTLMPTPPPPPPGGDFLLIAKADLLSRPTSGAAWQGALDWAEKTPDIDLSDLNADGDVVTLAKALVAARIGDAEMRAGVVSSLVKVQSSKVSRALELARGVGAYVLSADLIGYRDPAFILWAKAQRSRPVSSGPKTLDECAQVRPNNWGTWCRSSRLIIDLYTGDTADTAKSIALYRGYLGDRSQYASFVYGDLSWQCDSTKPVGINPPCSKSGHDIGGVLPDDQRRAGSFTWPPPCENYVAEALQGTTLEAAILTRQGYPAWQWSDSAIRRAVEFKYTNGCPFVGDDSDIPFLTDAAYGTHHAGSVPSQPGKGSGYADWWAR